jgi:hypothetical protein
MSHINQHGEIWPSIKQNLQQRYDVVAWIDLLYYDLDFDLPRLYSQLFEFSNREFTHNQRIVILHRDTDYYTDLDQPGFNLWNLYAICAYLNISSEYVILMSAHPTIELESKNVADEFNIPEFRTIYTPYQWWPVPEEVSAIDINTASISHSYVCLNGQPRPHRLYTLTQLHQHDLIDQGMVTLWPDAASITYDMSTQPKSNNLTPVPDNLHLRTTFNKTRINNRLLLTADQGKQYHRLFDLVKQKRTHSDVVGIPNDPLTRYQPKFLQHALWNLVTESVGDYPYGYLTEKTVKAILTKRPFIVLGGPCSLRTLKNLGFRTFDSWIDESYDRLDTFANRADAATKELYRFVEHMSTAELRACCESMQSILDYNFDHYVNGFGKHNLALFIENKL